MTSKAYDARGQFARAGDVYVKLEAPPQLLREHAFYGSAAEARVYISDTIWLAVGVVTMRPVREGGPCTLGMRWPDGVHVDDPESRKAIWEKIQETYHQTMAGAADWEEAKVTDWKKARGFAGPPGGGGARVKSNAEREAERQAKQREAEAQAEQRRKEAEDRKRQAEDAKAKGERMHQEGARRARAGEYRTDYTDDFFRAEDFFNDDFFDRFFNKQKPPPAPPPQPPGKPEGWPWNVLGFNGPVYDEGVLRKAYHRAARDAHPDHGGSTAKMQEVNVAHDECRHLAGIDKCGKGVKGCKLKHCAE